MRAPPAPSPQRKEQQSLGATQVSPSRPQIVLAMQIAPTQRPEQQASALAQLAPLGWHSTRGATRSSATARSAATTTSKSLRQPTDRSSASASAGRITAG